MLRASVGAGQKSVSLHVLYEGKARLCLEMACPVHAEVAPTAIPKRQPSRMGTPHKFNRQVGISSGAPGVASLADELRLNHGESLTDELVLDRRASGLFVDGVEVHRVRSLESGPLVDDAADVSLHHEHMSILHAKQPSCFGVFVRAEGEEYGAGVVAGVLQRTTFFPRLFPLACSTNIAPTFSGVRSS